MPTVPLYGTQQVEVAPISAPHRDQRINAQELGAGVAEAAGGTGDVAYQLHQDAQAKANQMAVMDADLRASKLASTLMYDPNTGAMNKQGLAAVGASSSVVPNLKKGIDDIDAGLANDEQRLAFRRMAAGRVQDVDSTLQRHVSGQIKQYDDQTTGAYVTQSQNDAAAHWQDPARVQLEISRQQAALTDHAKRNDIPPELLQLKQEQAASGTHLQVINQMLANQQDAAASAYYAEHKDDILGNDQAQAAKMVQAGNLAGNAQRITDSLSLDKDGVPESRGVLMAKIASDPEVQKDPKLRDAVTQRAEQFLTQHKMAVQEDQNQLFDRAEKAMIADPTQAPDDALNPLEWSALTGPQQESLIRRHQQILANEGPQDGSDDYYHLRTVASDPAHRDQFLATDLRTFRDKLSKKNYEEMLNLQFELRGNPSKGEAQLPGILSKEMVIKGTLAGLGIRSEPSFDKDNNLTNPAQVTEANNFRRALDYQVQAWEQVHGKKALPSDMQKLADQLIIHRVMSQPRSSLDPRSWWLFGGSKTVDVDQGPMFDLPELRGEAPAAGAK